MIKKIIFYSALLTIFATFCAETTPAQKYREIKPLISTCEDIKRIFNVEKCDYPSSNFDFSDYGITVNFSTDENEWKINKGIVTEAIIVLKPIVKLSDYEKDYKDYKIETDGDLPDVKLYINDKQGIRLTVEEINSEKYVTSIYLYPSEKIKQKLKCKATK